MFKLGGSGRRARNRQHPCHPDLVAAFSSGGCRRRAPLVPATATSIARYIPTASSSCGAVGTSTGSNRLRGTDRWYRMSRIEGRVQVTGPRACPRGHRRRFRASSSTRGCWAGPPILWWLRCGSTPPSPIRFGATSRPRQYNANRRRRARDRTHRHQPRRASGRGRAVVPPGGSARTTRSCAPLWSTGCTTWRRDPGAPARPQAVTHECASHHCGGAGAATAGAASVGCGPSEGVAVDELCARFKLKQGDLAREARVGLADRRRFPALRRHALRGLRRGRPGLRASVPRSGGRCGSPQPRGWRWSPQPTC